MDVTDDVQFTVHLHHPKFEVKEIPIAIPVLKDYKITHSHPIQLALLELHEGEDVSFLYE